MSEYENIVAEKLRLKGKLLDVKAGGITKKKKQRKHFKQFSTEINSSGKLPYFPTSFYTSSLSNERIAR